MISDYTRGIQRMEQRMRDSESRAADASKQVCYNSYQKRLDAIRGKHPFKILNYHFTSVEMEKIII